MNDPRIDSLTIIGTVFFLCHFFYFVIYYSRYSTLNHKLGSVAKLEKAGVIDQDVLTANKERLEQRIQKLKRISLWPSLAITVIHLVALLVSVSKTKTIHYIDTSGVLQTSELNVNNFPYFGFIGITLGGFALVLVANFIKGAYIFDPNKLFSGRTGRNW